MQLKFIKPAPGFNVRMPNGNVLPAEGAEVELNSYWLRRLEDGDVIQTNKPREPVAGNKK
ncbi:MAG: DUF2635 domain-containing protein [Chloroflexota bacterium]